MVTSGILFPLESLTPSNPTGVLVSPLPSPAHSRSLLLWDGCLSVSYWIVNAKEDRDQSGQAQQRP